MTEEKTTPSSGRIAWGRYLLLLCLAAWMFVLGILVGRGTAPIHFDTQALQKEIAALRDAMLRKERETVEKAIRGEDEKGPLEFYEALKKDGPDTAAQFKEPSEPESPATGGGKPAASPKSPHKTRAAVMAKTGTVAPKSADTAAPAEPPPPASSTGVLTIQVTALKDAAAAERIVANLKSKGYPAYLSRIVIPDQGLWFRVRVGSYQDSQQAAADMARLIQDQNNPILVTKQ